MIFRRVLMMAALAAIGTALLGQVRTLLKDPTIWPPDDFIEYWAAAKLTLGGQNPYDGVAATPAVATMINYTVLESPKPGGGETVPADDPRFRPGADAVGHVLREDRESFTAFHYEHAPEGFAAEYVVLAEFSGEFQLPPARVELMYKPTIGGHSESFLLKVAIK